MTTGIDMESVAERSAAYRALAEAFTYEGAENGPFGITGSDYTDAFDPAVNEKACSLRERTHTEEDQSSLFEDLMRFYEFFGLKRAEHAEMPDHLSVQLEFMHFLTHLEGKVADQPDELASIRRAQHDFLGRHLVRLVKAVHDGLNSQNQRCIELVDTAADFVNAEFARAKQYMQA
jgi:DMSO reductase family type II enzyme chaperone